MEKNILRDVIKESRKIRAERGDDFFSNKKIESKACTQIQENKINECADFDEVEKIRNAHHKLIQMIAINDEKIFDNSARVLSTKKTRSKSIHLYVDEKIEHFLKMESEKAQTHWELRKNAGLGNLIQKFILNFIEIKKREELQLMRLRKVIDDFKAQLVFFKKHSSDFTAVYKAEETNNKMKVLSNDLRILLSVLELSDADLKHLFNREEFEWINFILRWKLST